MITVGRLLIFDCLLVVTLQIGNVSPAPTKKTVGQLMLSTDLSNKKFGLVNYFAELGLDKYCNYPVLDVNNFTTAENDYDLQCFCTVIYNISREFDYSHVNFVDFEAAKNTSSGDKFKDEIVYDMWTNVTKISPSMKLLMHPLNNIKKWTKICYNFNNVLHSYCTFLNVEVLLMHSGIVQKSKESLKENDDPSKIIEKLDVPKVVTEESKNPEDIPQVKVDKSPENEINVVDPQKVVEVNNDDSNNNDEEIHAEKPKDSINIDDDEFTTEDEKLVEGKEALTPIDSKPDSESNADYPKEDDGIINHIETNDVVSKFSLKNKFSNHAFGDTEDSHFLFYFSIMTILSMLFYLALYNKKKIIALLIEGRRSTNHRRRPNTASYSKVETDEGSTVF